MFLKLSDEQKSSIFGSLKRVFNYDTKIKIVDINFNKPWYHIFLLERFYLITTFVSMTLIEVSSTAFPIVSGIALNNNAKSVFIGLLVFSVFIRFLKYASGYIVPIISININSSVKAKAYEHLLLVDPRFHMTRSSGQIINKINRGTNAIKSLIDILLFSIFLPFVSFVTTVVSISLISPTLGLNLTIVIILLIAVNTLMYRIRTDITYSIRIKSEDSSSAVYIESMNQVQYVRSTFSTSDQINNMFDSALESMVDLATVWRMSQVIILITDISYSLFMLYAGFYLLSQNINTVILVSVIISLYSLGRIIRSLGKPIEQLIQGIEDVNDLWEFMAKFGDQTYPVLHTSIGNLE